MLKNPDRERNTRDRGRQNRDLSISYLSIPQIRLFYSLHLLDLICSRTAIENGKSVGRLSLATRQLFLPSQCFHGRRTNLDRMRIRPVQKPPQVPDESLLPS